MTPLDQKIAEVDFSTNSYEKMFKCGMIKRANTGMFIRLKDLHDKLRPDGSCWNSRDMTSEKTVEYVNSIATHIFNKGQLPAIEVQPRVGGGVQKVDGYCRAAAYAIADASGTEGEIWVRIVPFDGDELAALVRQETSDKKQAKTPLEQLDIYSRIRDQMRAQGFKGTLAEIAEQVDVSRQYVDQILKLEKLDDEGKALVADGKVSVAVAVKAVRDDADNATQALQEASKSAGGKKATTATVKKAKEPAVSKSLLLDMHGHLEGLRASLDAKAALTAEKYLKGEVSGEELVVIEVGDLARLLALLSEGDRQILAAKERAVAKSYSQASVPMVEQAPQDDASEFAGLL